MCEHITRDLIERGFTVVSASDGPGALELLRTWAIDAIVLDMMLPKVDGIALIPLVRRITQIPIIMVSGKFDLAMRIAALAAGADDYLLKPFDLSELAARINSALRRPLLHDAQEPNAHRSGGELLPE
jgi:DNA-binding response OmpR family regulator